jgi:hypothetical protein
VFFPDPIFIDAVLAVAVPIFRIPVFCDKHKLKSPSLGPTLEIFKLDVLGVICVVNADEPNLIILPVKEPIIILLPVIIAVPMFIGPDLDPVPILSVSVALTVSIELDAKPAENVITPDDVSVFFFF